MIKKLISSCHYYISSEKKLLGNYIDLIRGIFQRGPIYQELLMELLKLKFTWSCNSRIEIMVDNTYTKINKYEKNQQRNKCVIDAEPLNMLNGF